MKYNPPHHTNPYPHSPRPIIRNFSLFLCSSFLSSDRDKLTRARYDNRATPKSLVKSSSCHENLGWMLRRGREKLFIVKHHHPSSHRVARVSVFGVSVFLYFFFPIVERCSLLLNSIMCVWVYVRVFIPSLPFMGLFSSCIPRSFFTQCLLEKV
jgi:hypothetical protein